MNSRLFTFIGGSAGSWRVANIQTVIGEPLSTVSRIKVTPGEIKQLPSDAKWSLRGITSNERYVVRSEQEQLLAKQPALGRPEAVYAALIPVRKNISWWNLSQDERRQIFEEQSKHVHLGLQYLPAIARRLHHCRDLSENEPFDFLTWFEYAPPMRRLSTNWLPSFENLRNGITLTERSTFGWQKNRPNQLMKPTAPTRCNLSEVVTAPCGGLSCS